MTSNMLDGFTAAEQHDVGSIKHINWTGQFGLALANAEAHGRWGLGIITSSAFSATAGPLPLADHRFPWYWTEAFNTDEPTVEFYKIAGKLNSVRRFPSVEHNLFFVCENSVASAGTVKFDLHFRILVAFR